MSHNSILPYFLLMGGFIAFASLMIRPGGFFDNVLKSEEATRYESIDGLRSFLAFGVFFTHAQVNLQYFETGKMSLPTSAFYTTLGEFSVSLFFVITAFLFWGKILRANGKISALRLYRGRNRRLTPMYLVSVVLVFLVVGYRTSFELQVPLSDFAYQIVSWLTYGLFAIPQLPDINGLTATHSIQGVYWTLTFEWEFYLLLPLLALLPYRTLSLCIVMGALAFLMPLPPVVIIVVNFAFGAVAAWFMHNYDIHYLKGRVFDILMLLILAMILLLFSRGQGLPQYLLGFIFFMLLVSGNTLFGMLVSRPVKLLGMISYSVYLLHNIIINIVFYHLDQLDALVSLTPTLFWSVTATCGVAVIVLSATSYRFVEHPFLTTKTSSVVPTGTVPSQGEYKR